jgi:tRNA threonylcarbamoyladenosine biosynthesis protein TsaB
MRILSVDTTTPSGSVAVLADQRLLGETSVESSSTHSARLLSSINLLLEALHLGIQDIDGFAVTPGPGSFTGIRIGLSTVKAFAFASDKPVAPVSSLQALAWKLRDSKERLIAPMLDAKKGEIYAGLFEMRKERLAEMIPQGAYSPDRFLSLLPARRTVQFIGNGIEICRAKILDRFKDRARFSARSPFMAYEVGLLGHDILKAGKGVPSTELEPLYFRKSQAEEKH